LPYNYPVQWSAIVDSTVNGNQLMGPYTYVNKNWLPPSTISVLSPWEGYYVMNTGTSTITMRIPSIATVIKQSKISVDAYADSSKWVLEWRVSNGKSSAQNNFFGTVARKDGWLPPGAPGRTFSTAFVSNGMDFIEVYTKDGQKNGIWNIEIKTTDNNEDFTASIAGMDRLPDDVHLALLDMKRKVKVTISKAGEFNFAVDKVDDVRSFKLIAGDSAFVAKNSAGFGLLPKEFSLSSNVPNPFNPSTLIKYAVAEKGKGRVAVSIKVYDARGRFVKTLINSKHESGYYTVQWNSKNEYGKSVGSGAYFYRITIGRDFVKTRKMVMLK
ncbi:MAG: T9SS type A sorting domain-containing protein, partial [Fibrobacteres bacterium]|nr:T9SS type A sorting domain-containing protein [Fibrobacterota bacterium]